MIAQMKADAVKNEEIESLVSILIGVNITYCKCFLKNFEEAAGFDQFIDAGNASDKTLARLAAFVSKSISSQSQSLGTGGPSQNLSF